MPYLSPIHPRLFSNDIFPRRAFQRTHLTSAGATAQSSRIEDDPCAVADRPPIDASEPGTIHVAGGTSARPASVYRGASRARQRDPRNVPRISGLGPGSVGSSAPRATAETPSRNSGLRARHCERLSSKESRSLASQRVLLVSTREAGAGYCRAARASTPSITTSTAKRNRSSPSPATICAAWAASRGNRSGARAAKVL